MNPGNYIGLLIVAAPFFILVTIGYWKLFQKAGEQGWKALIPVYSSYIMLKISGRPGWWVVLLFIPAAGWVVGVGILVDFIKCFGKCYLRNRAAAVLVPFICLPKWGFDRDTRYLGPSASPAFRLQYPYSIRPISPLQWAQAVFFSVFTAIFIRVFFMEIYVIPTPSMEASLLVGDNVVVSKVSYGARLPMTPIAFPFANNTLPYGDLKAYWDGLQLPYLRLPGFTSVKRNDVVVFNYPEDTLENRPVDKKEIYVKRCEGIPGDTVMIRDGEVYLDGKLQKDPPERQDEYHVVATDTPLNPELFHQLHIHTYDGFSNPSMTRQAAAELRKYSNIKLVTRVVEEADTAQDSQLFPTEEPAGLPIRIPRHNWSADNYGPVIVPKKGLTVKLDSLTLPLYARVIKVYEHNSLRIKNGALYINGKISSTYSFKMNYYWMLGDNWHDSYDSRYWGFVPEDHLIGKAIFTWISWNADAPLFEKFRWDRLLKPIH